MQSVKTLFLTFLTGLLALTPALSTSARPLDAAITAQGASMEEAEANAYNQAIKQAMQQNYGLPPDNPVSRHLQQLPIGQQRHLFDPPMGVIVKSGSVFRGNLTFDSRDTDLEGAIKLFVEEVAQKTGLVSLPFAMTASIAPTVTIVSGDRQFGIASDLNTALGEQMVAMGLKGSPLPKTLEQRLFTVTRSSRPEVLANLYQELLPQFLDDISKAENGEPAAVVLGNFNIFTVQSGGRGVIVHWEVRGAFYDLRGRAVDKALVTPLSMPNGESYGPDIETALRNAYSMAANALVTGNLLDAVTKSTVVQPPLVIHLCGAKDLDGKLAAQNLLRSVAGSGTLTPDHTMNSFSLRGAPHADAVQLYGALKPGLANLKWKADLEPDGTLLIKATSKCGRGTG